MSICIHSCSLTRSNGVVDLNFASVDVFSRKTHKARLRFANLFFGSYVLFHYYIESSLWQNNLLISEFQKWVTWLASLTGLTLWSQWNKKRSVWKLNAIFCSELIRDKQKPCKVSLSLYRTVTVPQSWYRFFSPVAFSTIESKPGYKLNPMHSSFFFLFVSLKPSSDEGYFSSFPL